MLGPLERAEASPPGPATGASPASAGGSALPDGHRPHRDGVAPVINDCEPRPAAATAYRSVQ